MNPPSAAQFETNSRIHLALAVKSVERSIAFYTSLFGRSPTKVRPGYARFEVAEPSANLSLNEVGGGDRAQPSGRPFWYPVEIERVGERYRQPAP